MTVGVGPGASATTRVVDRGDGFLFGEYRNVLVAIWTAQGTAALVERLATATESFLRSHPEGISSLHFVAKGTPLATSEARDGLISLMRTHGASLACVGTVLEGSGFWASATRSLILGMRLLAPRSFEMQTYASIPELAGWLPAPHAARTGVTLAPKDLERALNELRSLAG